MHLDCKSIPKKPTVPCGLSRVLDSLLDCAEDVLSRQVVLFHVLDKHLVVLLRFLCLYFFKLSLQAFELFLLLRNLFLMDLQSKCNSS